MQSNGGSTTSSLRQWRKKDFVEKQASSETNQLSTNEHPSHIARVAPHTYYPRPTEDPCNFQQQFGEYSATFKPPAPVKYSEIVENQQTQSVDHITPVIQKQKEKEYGEMCNGTLHTHLKQYSEHLSMKQSTYPDSLSVPHQYIPKDYSFLQKQSQMHQYMQKEPYQQFLSKYNIQNQFPPQSTYNSQPNDFLAHLNKINPRMAQSIINDTHLRDSQIPMYHNFDQSRPYPQPQRLYHSPTASSNLNNSQRNLGPTYNYPQYNYNIKPNMSPGDPYNRVHQYHHNASKYVPEQHIPNISPQRYYNDHMNYPPFPPNYSQLEYAQHYQHRRQFPQEYYPHPSYKGAYQQNAHISPEEITAESATRKSSLKQYLESWVEEDMTGNVPDIIAPNQLNNIENIESLKGTMSNKAGDSQDQPLYVLDTTDIPNDNLPHFLHLQQVEKLPDNIKGYYQQNTIANDRRVIVENHESSIVNNESEKENLSGAIIPEIFEQGCSIVATVENNEAEEKISAEKNLENKVVQIHIMENTEAADFNESVSVASNSEHGQNEVEGVIKMCKKSVVTSELSDSQSSFKSMPDITDESNNLDKCNDDNHVDNCVSNCCDFEEQQNLSKEGELLSFTSFENTTKLNSESVITHLKKAVDNKEELVISNHSDTENKIPDLCDITDDTNTSKDSETLQKTDINNEQINDIEINVRPSEDLLQEGEMCNLLDETITEVEDGKMATEVDQVKIVQNTMEECLDNFFNEFTCESDERNKTEIGNTEMEVTEVVCEEVENKEVVLPTLEQHDEKKVAVEGGTENHETLSHRVIKRKSKVQRDINPKKRKKIKRPRIRTNEKEENVITTESSDKDRPVIEQERFQEITKEHMDDINMPVLERETLDETKTNVVYHIDDSNVVLQIGDELLEINVTVQNDKKIIMVKTFSDAVIMNNTEENSCPILEDQTTLDAQEPIVEDISNVETIEEEVCDNIDIPIVNDVCVYNEEIVSSSTENESTSNLLTAKEVENNLEDDKAEKVQVLDKDSTNKSKCLEPKAAKKNFKTKAALKLLEPQNVTEVPCKSKSKIINDLMKEKLTKLQKRRGAIEDDYLKNRYNKSKHKDDVVKQRKIESHSKSFKTTKKKVMKASRIKKKVDKKDKMEEIDVAKNNIDMLYKMSIIPKKLTKTKAEAVTKHKEGVLSEKINVKLSSEKKEVLSNVQENSITSSTCQESEANSQRRRANKIIQQINDDWEDDLDLTEKQEDTNKRRLSLQEYNDRKRLQEQNNNKSFDYDKFDLTSNLLQNVSKARELSPKSPLELNVNLINKTYSRNVLEKEFVEKQEEPLSSRIELQLPNHRRLLPKPNYNQEYLRNALMNDLHTVNQITTTLMKENQQLMHRFLEQQRLTSSELKKVKQIIRYKRLVHHLTTMKLKESREIDACEDKVDGNLQTQCKKVIATEKRKKKRFRFLYSDNSSESELQESSPLVNIDKTCYLKQACTDDLMPAVDYSVHQRNSQGQLTLVFKRSFKSDPKMQPFVKLERIPSLDWLASKL